MRTFIALVDLGIKEVQRELLSVGRKEKGGQANRPSPQSPKGILGSRPPRRQRCKLNAIRNSCIFSVLLAKST
jgi:hypothetical protein